MYALLSGAPRWLAKRSGLAFVVLVLAVLLELLLAAHAGDVPYTCEAHGSLGSGCTNGVSNVYNATGNLPSITAKM